MISIVLMVLCFFGFVCAANRWLKIDFSHAPIFAISLVGILLFLFALIDKLQTGTSFLIFAGFVFFVFWVGTYFLRRKQVNAVSFFKASAVLGLILAMAYLLTLGMSFTVIDDYVYWGIMGKYLFLNNHLPVAGSPLDVRILAYTPGTALIHYFFYLIVGKYSIHISYFAQSIILISALFVVVQKDRLRTSLVYAGILVLILTLFFGSVFTKLQVDYLLSVICFSIFWIYVTEKRIYVRLLAVSAPICFLFLVKEVGFVLGMLLLLMIACDVLANRQLLSKKKIISLAVVFLIGAVLFGLKTMWISHVNEMGFVQFHTAMTFKSVMSAFRIFSDPAVYKGFLISLKAFFIGPADRLNIPYLFWYLIILILGARVMKTIRPDQRTRAFVFTGLCLVSFLLYAVMLYCMQIIIFRVGVSHDQAVGFSRYLNILFSPLVLICGIVFLDRVSFHQKETGKRLFAVLGSIVVLVLIASRLEVTLHREKEDVHIQRVSEEIRDRIEKNGKSIGILSKKNGLPQLQFLYYLLPNETDYRVSSFADKEQLEKFILKYDYVILYHPEPKLLDWLSSYSADQKALGQVGLLQRVKDTADVTSPGPVLFKSIPLEQGL